MQGPRATLLVLAMLPLALLAPAPAPASSGEFERTWGKDVDSSNPGTGFEICLVAASCQAGTTGALGGELNSAAGVGTDAAGNIYVSDNVNNRIQKFDSSGTFERTWGKGVNMTTGGNLCTAASGDTCQAGTTGALGGELNNVPGVAADPAGNVYAADYVNNRIQKFDSSGTFQRAWGKDVVATGSPDNTGVGFEVCVAANGDTCQAGTTGGLGGEMNVPSGVAADAAGNVYVGDQGNFRIQKFDSAGNFERAWGKDVVSGNVNTGFEICTVAADCQAGPNPFGPYVWLGGELQYPFGVAADAAGNVYVVDNGNKRVQKFDAAGNFQRTWGKDVDSANLGTGFEICTVAASCQAGATGGLGGEFSSSFLHVAADAAGSVYVADTNSYRIQRFDSTGAFQRTWGKDVDSANPGTGFEICTVAASCQAGATGGLGGEFNSPIGVGADTAGNVYVSDAGSSRIQKFLEPPAPPAGAVPPDNSFTIGKLKRRKLPVTVQAEGTATVDDAAHMAKRKLLLKPSSATGGPGTIKVKLKLTSAAKKKLKRKVKVKVKARVTFTPTGGTPNSKTKKLKVKK